MKKNVQIGLLHSFTGTMAISEQALLDAENLAIDEINLTGGVLGHLIEPVIADGASDSQVFQHQAERFVNLGIRQIFGCWTSASRKAVKPIMENNDCLLWYPVQYEGLEESQNIIYSGSCLNQQITPAVEWMLTTLGKSIYLIGSNYVFPLTANKLVKSIVKSHSDARIVGERYLSLGAQNFDQIISELQSLQPDVVFNALNGDSNIAFFRRLHEEGLSPGRLPTVSVSMGELEIGYLGNAAVGHFTCWSYFSSLENSENRSFLERFRNKYGVNRPCSAPMVMAYMQIYFWKNAVECAGSFETAEIRRVLPGMELASPAGLLTINSNNHLTKGCHIGRSASNGQFEIVWSSPDRIRPLPWLGVEQCQGVDISLIKEAMAGFTDSVHYSGLLQGEMEERLRISSEVIQLRERELKSNELFLEKIIENIPATIFVKDARTLRYVKVNRAFEQLTGHSREELLGKNDHDFFPVDVADRFVGNDQLVLAGREVVDTPEETIYTQYMDERILHTKKIPLVDDLGNTQYLLGIAEDITDRKQTEKKLKNSEQRLKSLFTSSPAVIYSCGTSGDYGATFISDNIVKYFGYTPEEFLCDSSFWTSRIHPDDRDRVFSGISQWSLQGPYRHEYRFLHQDGSYRWTHDEINVLRDVQGQPVEMIGALLDITERKNTELKVLEAEGSFQTIFESSPIPLLVIAGDRSRFIYFNKAFLQTFGYTSDNMPTPVEWAMEAFPDETYRQFLKDRWASNLIELRNSGKPSEPVECDITCKDGSIRTVLGTTAFMNQSVNRDFLVTLFDITERKVVEKACRKSEEQHQTILQTAMDGFWVVNLHGKLVEVNQAYCEMSGYSKQELLNMYVSDLDALESSQDITLKIKRIKELGKMKFETRHRHKDGRLFDIECSVQYLDVAGDQLFAFFRNITERKHSEKILQERNERLDYLLTSTPAVIYTCSVCGDFSITYISHNVKNLTGYQPHHFIDEGTFWKKNIHPDDVGHIVSALAALPEKVRYELEFRFKNSDGFYRWMHSELKFITNHTGEPIEIIGFLIDITERKKATDALKLYAQRLIELDEELRRKLSAELHDEICSDLAVNTMRIAMIREVLPPRYRAKVTDFLNDSQEVLVAINGKVRNMMAELRPPTLDDYGLSAALRWYCNVVNHHLRFSISHLIADDFPRLPLPMEVALFRIAQEAIANIIKHANAQTAMITLRMTMARQCILSISDDGKGFNAELVDGRQIKSGWGLTIMRERAELIGGEFVIKSSPERGTTIMVAIMEINNENSRTHR